MSRASFNEFRCFAVSEFELIFTVDWLFGSSYSKIFFLHERERDSLRKFLQISQLENSKVL